jgi:hypothetical protein
MGNKTSKHKHVRLSHSLGTEELKKLLFSVRPIVYLAEDEDCYPSTIEFILEHSALYKGKELIAPRGSIKNGETLLEYQDNYGTNLRLDIDKKIWYGKNQELSLVPFYVDSYEDGEYIVGQYSFIYPYNGVYKVCGKNYGEHQGDVEHVDLWIHKEKKEVHFMKAYFAAHRSYDGEWLDKKQITFSDKRPIVFSAYHGHGSYWKAQTWFRVCCLANDHTSYGEMWNPSYIEYITSKTPWNQFKGEIGDPSSPLNHDWWHNSKAEHSATFCSRICCPWK